MDRADTRQFLEKLEPARLHVVPPARSELQLALPEVLEHRRARAPGDCPVGNEPALYALVEQATEALLDEAAECRRRFARSWTTDAA